MSKLKKEKKELEISLGLLTGYLIAGFCNMFFFDKTFWEAFSQQELIYGFLGIGISVFLIYRLSKKKQDDNKEVE